MEVTDEPTGLHDPVEHPLALLAGRTHRQEVRDDQRRGRPRLGMLSVSSLVPVVEVLVARRVLLGDRQFPPPLADVSQPGDRLEQVTVQHGVGREPQLWWWHRCPYLRRAVVYIYVLGDDVQERTGARDRSGRGVGTVSQLDGPGHEEPKPWGDETEPGF